MLALQIFLLVLGFVLLVKGADWFVDGSSDIAARFKISPLVIGLTVVAFGTSAPELAVSLTSAIKHSTGLAIGNVVGSNIANILLILGIAALICKLPVQKNSLTLDLPVLVFASALLIFCGVFDGAVNWWDGLIFIAVMAAYLAVLLIRAKRDQKRGLVVSEPEEKKPPRTAVGKWIARMKEHFWFLILLTLVGIGMVVGGGTLLVNAAKYIAEFFGVSEDVIGLTVVAIGTSLPELVTSVVAAAKGETDIAVGNVIGSNIFNILIVAGISSLAYPLTFTVGENLIDALVALAAALLLCFLALLDGNKINRKGGVVMLLTFVLYYVYLFALRV